MPVLRMLLAKGTRVPLDPWHWKKRRCKKECQQYEGMTMDASWLVLVLNIDLQFETWEGFIHWVLKKKKKPHTKPPPLKQWRENCRVETGQPQSQARKGPGCGSKVCHRAPKMHLIDFHLLVKIQKIHKYHRKIPESTPDIKACSHLTQFLKMLHFFPSENRRQEAHGQASFSAFTLKRIMPFYSQGGKKKKTQEKPTLQPSPMPFTKLVSKYLWCRDAYRKGIRGGHTSAVCDSSINHNALDP